MQRVAAAVSTLSFLGALSNQTAGQAVNSGVGVGPSERAANAAAQDAVAPTVEHVLGDLAVRTHLEQQGVFLLLDATTELAGNVSGGLRA